MLIGERDLRAANKLGIKDAQVGEFTSFYTPLLQIAYNIGLEGKELGQMVSGYRYGGIPESGISQNYATDTAEMGLSLAALDGEKECPSVIWFRDDRKKVSVKGLLSPVTGSDGESLVLPVGVIENWDY